MNNHNIVNLIFNAHKSRLQNGLVGIIFCGGITLSKSIPTDDIDYVIILKSLTTEAVRLVAEIRSELEVQLDIQVSNTLLIENDIEQFNESFMRLDGKAVQAVIEMPSNIVRWSKEQKTPPRLTPSALHVFSTQNFFTLRSLLMKLLVRSSTPLSLEEKKKMAKIALIMLKMLKQMGYDSQEIRDFTNNLLLLKNGRLEQSDKSIYTTLLGVSTLINGD